MSCKGSCASCNPKRCLVRLYKLYNSLCPTDRPDKAFYLKPLVKPKEDCWYTKTPLGHNTLSRIVTRLFENAGISGHYTSHSLRATAATRMFDAGVDEQLIMSRTGHSSSNGVRSYKRITENLKEMTSNVLNGQQEKKIKLEESQPEQVEIEEIDITNKENHKQVTLLPAKSSNTSFVPSLNFLEHQISL